jgi:hypothetical protein
MKNWTVLCFLSCIGAICHAQQLLQRLDPALYSTFQSGHPLPGGTHRIYFTTNVSRYQYYSSPYFLDWNPAEDTVSQWAPIDATSGFPILYYAAESLVLPFPNGDCIFVANNFDCDFPPRPTILYIQADREVRWSKREYDEDYYWSDVSEIGMVNQDTLVFLTYEGPRFTTLAGEEIELPVTPPYYVDIAFIGDRIIGRTEQELFLFDDQFAILDSRFMEGIRFVSAIGPSVIIQSDSTLWMFDDLLQVQGQFDFPADIKSAQLIDDSISVVTNDATWFFDQSLLLIDSLPACPSESMKYVVSDEDSIKVLSVYNGLNHRDACVRKYPHGTPAPVPTFDVSLTEVAIPDTILVERPLGVYYAIQYVFDTIQIGLHHEGSDTLFNCKIEFDWSSGGLCGYYRESWLIDSIAIPPGGDKTILITDFITDTIYYETRPPFCFWAESPNGIPDPDPTNNKACNTPNLVLSTNDIPQELIDIVPNPASAECYIAGIADDGKVWQVQFYSLQGMLEKSVNISSIQETIPIADLPEGMHIIHVAGRNGLRAIAKLIIQR